MKIKSDKDAMSATLITVLILCALLLIGYVFAEDFIKAASPDVSPLHKVGSALEGK